MIKQISLDSKVSIGVCIAMLASRLHRILLASSMMGFPLAVLLVPVFSERFKLGIASNLEAGEV